MDEQNKNTGGTEDAFDLLSKRFDSFGHTTPEMPEDDVKNSGEIYFSANSDNINRTPQVREQRYGGASSRPANASRSLGAGAQRASTSARQGAASAKTGTARTAGTTGKKSTKKKKKKSRSNVAVAIGVVAVVVLLAVIVRIPIMWCVNDILAINADSTHIRVVITDNMDVDDVINLLGKKKLVNSTGFCKIAAKFLKYDKKSDKTKRVYPAGEYDLSSSMGLEGMLNEILSAGSEDSTVTLTFPEGYTVSQIAAKLSSNGVCSTAEFYAALSDQELLKGYDFLADITDKNLRYKLLEGYLYPDTYEFYIDETPRSVVKRFLDNFESKWNDMFAEKAKKSNYSIDEILTVASILEREAKNAEQMPVIASVIYNRLGSSSFPYINCDSTGKYIAAYQEELAAKGVYANYVKSYDTYQKTGLPVGPICNPGKQAINAAISPDSTSYYYFLHDKDGKLYLASTQSEHDRNKAAAGIE